MAQGIVQDRRADRASGIVERQELHLRDDGTWQVRDTAGSGKWHTILDQHCTCPDYVYRHMTCKHLRAVAAEERALAHYGATWDARAEQLRQTSVKELSEVANFANPGSIQGPTCPTCNAALECQSYYIGGRGLMAFLVCTKDAQHQALPA